MTGYRVEVVNVYQRHCARLSPNMVEEIEMPMISYRIVNIVRPDGTHLIDQLHDDLGISELIVAVLNEVWAIDEQAKNRGPQCPR